MKLYYLLMGFSLFSLRGHAQQTEPRYSRTTEKRIAQVEQNLNGPVMEAGKPAYSLAERMAYYHVNGLSIAVIHDFKIDWLRSYGWADHEKQQRVTVHTAFQAGSVSKAVNAIALMQLAQEGKLQLDGDINRGLKSWQFPYDSVSKGVKITLRHLLSHRAGLNMSGYAGYAPEDTIPDIYQILEGRSPAESSAVQSRLIPGTAYRYSGGGVIIAQLMAMDADGRDYEGLMRRRLFDPLDMKNSSFDAGALSQKASGYYWNGRPLPGGYRLYPEAAAAGLWTTPEDLAKLLIAYQLSYTGRSQALLRQPTARSMAEPDPQSVQDRNRSTLGFFMQQHGGRNYLTHDGKVEGFLSLFFIDPEKGDGVVVMNNGNDAIGLNTEVINSVAKIYGWRGFNVPEVRTTVRLEAEMLPAYCGAFINGKDTVTLLPQKNGLGFTSTFSYYGRPQEVTFISPNEFYVYEEELFTAFRGYKNRYFIRRNNLGEINAIIQRVNGKPDKIFLRS